MPHGVRVVSRTFVLPSYPVGVCADHRTRCLRLERWRDGCRGIRRRAFRQRKAGSAGGGPAGTNGLNGSNRSNGSYGSNDSSGNLGAGASAGISLTLDVDGGINIGDGGANGGCRPRTCVEAKATCGPVSDGCGNELLCGTCKTGQICEKTTNACVTKTRRVRWRNGVWRGGRCLWQLHHVRSLRRDGELPERAVRRVCSGLLHGPVWLGPGRLWQYHSMWIMYRVPGLDAGHGNLRRLREPEADVRRLSRAVRLAIRRLWRPPELPMSNAGPAPACTAAGAVCGTVERWVHPG